MKPTMGVFQIKNEVNGKVLIEGSTDMAARWNRYQTELKFGSHKNKDLQKDWKEYGAEKFTFKVLSELEHKKDENADYNKEVKILEEMIVEDLKINEDVRY